jgi:hypothetical protein
MPMSGGKTTPYVGTSVAISPRYWIPCSIQLTSGTSVVSPDRLYAQPLNLPGLTIDRLGIEVTAGAAGLCRIGLYTNDNGVPGALIADGGAIDTTSVAIVEANIQSLVLPEWCWVAAVYNAAPTCRAGLGIQSPIGTSSPGSQPRGLISTGVQAFGTLPLSAPSMSFVSTMGLMFVRKS